MGKEAVNGNIKLAWLLKYEVWTFQIHSQNYLGAVFIITAIDIITAIFDIRILERLITHFLQNLSLCRIVQTEI